MSADLTLALVDDEPWNQRPERPRRVAPTLTARGRVYSGPSRKPQDAAELTEAWQEWEQTATRGDEKPYRPVRCFDLCEACGEALRALPPGARWVRSKSKAAVLARCLRSLERVGHAEAVEALRALRGRR